MQTRADSAAWNRSPATVTGREERERNGSGVRADAGHLGNWKAWMVDHNAAIMIVLLTVPGADHIGDAAAPA